MSGHNKWSTIKHKKGAADAKRGRIFTRLIKEITVAARMGGGDVEGNARLRTAVAKARESAMPADNIDRAIKRGTGELEGGTIEELTYEGYGPGGTALLIEVQTDNRNRTVADLRHMLNKHNGSLSESGSVAWMFKRKGQFVFDKALHAEDALMERCLELDGFEDLQETDDGFELTTTSEAYYTIKERLEKDGVTCLSAELSMVPQTTVRLEGKHAESMLRLMDKLDDHDDVQHVYSNFDISAEEMEKFSG